jgi:PAS domain S-box-containing protein
MNKNKSPVHKSSHIPFSETHYKSLIESLPHKVFLKDTQSTYIACNENFAHDLHIDSDEIVGKTDYDFFPPEMAEKYQKDDKKTIDSGETKDIKEKYIYGGEERFVHTIKTPLLDSDGHVMGILGIFWDITKEMQIEQTLEQQTEDLKNRIKELQCIYSIGELTRSGDSSIDTVLQQIVELVPSGWGKPEKTQCRILFETNSYQTDAFKKTPWMQKAQFSGDGDSIGVIEVSYLNPDKEADSDPFSLEEQDLLDAIAAHIGEFIHRRSAEQKLRETMEIQQFKNDFLITMGKQTSLKETLGSALSTFFQLSEFDSGGIYLVDESTGAVDLVEHQKLPQWFVDTVKHFDSDDIRVQMIMKGDPIYQHTSEFAPSIRGHLQKEGIRTLAIIPIRLGDRVIGALNMASHTHDIITWKTMKIIEEIASSNLGSTITRVRTREALQESRELVTEFRAHFTRLFNEAHDAILIFDLEGQFLDFNRKAVKLLGYSEEELKTMTVWDLLPPYEKEDSESKLKKLVKGDRIPVFERILLTKDGTSIPVENSAFVVRDENGKAKFIQSILRDIRDRKESERKIQETLRDLERSNKELQQFAYVASHDLQEPLRMVASFTQLLEKRYTDKLDNQAREYINFAVDGANRMQNLINALLMYSRVGTRGKSFEPTDSTAVLAQVLVNLKSQIEENHAIITNGELPTVMADESQLVQLFQNLISNAIKFRTEKTPHIHISVECTEDTATFAISDNGMGIDSAYLDKIFVIFQRLDGHTFPGTGIGLAICKKIVERHGGRIWVESESGEGSTFYFTIPLKEVTPNG